ncbi:hypothetical protein ACOMICROBIO_EPCKBFOG_03775 [Vibrio sp. B1FLJ16]|nr:hypothetical protein ACOMICROBIO_EPCKBFOG_03775 [Vibrio sp. B1FLJ16]CAE6941366.1 hypothetical protein ACOMICROBIO_EPCKBFOG_03775 [Vibrio sp. B1FLJ16]
MFKTVKFFDSLSKAVGMNLYSIQYDIIIKYYGMVKYLAKYTNTIFG